MAIVFEQWPLSVLGTPSDMVGMLSSFIVRIKCCKNTTHLFILSFFEQKRQMCQEQTLQVAEEGELHLPVSPSFLDNRQPIFVKLGTRLDSKVSI